MSETICSLLMVAVSIAMYEILLFIALVTLRERYSFLALLEQGKYEEAYGFSKDSEKTLKLVLIKKLRFICRIILGISLEVLLLVEMVIAFRNVAVLVIVSAIITFAAEIYYFTDMNELKCSDILQKANVKIHKSGRYSVTYKHTQESKYVSAMFVSCIAMIASFLSVMVITVIAVSSIECTQTTWYEINECRAIPVELNRHEYSGEIKDYYFNCSDQAGKIHDFVLDKEELEEVSLDENQAVSLLGVSETTEYRRSLLVYDSEYEPYGKSKTYSLSLASDEIAKNINSLLN